VPAPSELRIGTAAETADARTRSHLADGRVVGWYGEPGVVIDAEIAAAVPPAHLSARFGSEDFWLRWTAAECAAKLHDLPIPMWIRERGLAADGIDVEHVQVGDVVVGIGRRTVRSD
jgi:hypothetical protein